MQKVKVTTTMVMDFDEFKQTEIKKALRDYPGKFAELIDTKTLLIHLPPAMGMPDTDVKFDLEGDDDLVTDGGGSSVSA